MSDNSIVNYYNTNNYKNDHNFDFNKKTQKIIKHFMQQKNIMVRHHIEAFDHLMMKYLPEIIEERNPLKFTDKFNMKYNKFMIEYHVSFTGFKFSKPVIKENDGSLKTMYPQHARLRNLTYATELYCDIEHKLIKHSEDGSTEKIEFDRIPRHNCGKIPLMINSSTCALNEVGNRTQREMGECAYDEGAYFIVGGSEKVIVLQEKKADNNIYCFTKNKGSGNTISKYSHIAEVTSIDPATPYNQNNVIQLKVQTKRSLYGGHLMCIGLKSLKNDIPVMLIFKAFGILSDRSILEYIVHDVDDETNVDIMQFVRPSLEELVSVENADEALSIIAEDFNLKNMSMIDGTSEENNRIRLINVYKNLVNELFPHIAAEETDDGYDMSNKLYYLGYMIKRLICQVLEKLPLDNRDSFLNKRIENVSDLIASLYRNNFAKMIRELSKKIQKEIRAGRIEEIHTHLQKDARTPNIDSGIKYSFSTGNWGPKNKTKRAGVAQLLQRKSYLDALSNKRKIVNPMKKESKQYEPRKLHPSQWGYICPSETPEGANVGIVKNMALTSYITLTTDQTPVWRSLIRLGTTKLSDQKPFQLYGKTKIFLNGKWLGIHKHPHELYYKMKMLKRKGIIHIHTSISWDIDVNEMYFFTDSGRLTRPLYIVKDNDVLLTDEIIENLESGEWTFSDLLYRGATDEDGEEVGIIEYVDVYEANTAMIAFNYDDLKNNSRDNDTFKTYTHCEIHESMIMGVVVSHVPFSECNQGPRNVYIGAQMKQAVSIYATNYNDRLDTMGQILHYPQKRLVNTRVSKYLHGDIIPSGTLTIIAIACCTGYNQEDSLIFNKYAIDRGFFNSTHYRTVKDEEKKNQSNLDGEKFCKPQRYDANGKPRTEGFKAANYEKLDDNGFIRVGSLVKGNDVLIGKETPLKNTTDSGIKNRDASTIMRHNESGVVDKAYVSLNNEGYRVAKIRVKSNRNPQIGDKFACYDPETDVLTSEGWKNITELTMEDRVATLQDGSRLEYHFPDEIQEYDHEGRMYCVKSNQIDLKVTPNHRLWIADRSGKKFRIVKAEDAFGKQRKYMKDVEVWEPEDPIGDTFTLPEYIHTTGRNGDEVFPEREVDMDAWLIFYGIWLAEGCTLRDWSVQFATHKDRVKEGLIEACKTLEFKIHEHHEHKGDTHSNQWCMPDKQLTAYIKPLSVGAVDKKMEDWVWRLNREQCRTLIHGMMLGDGHTMKNGTRRYDTSSTQLADDFQRLCLHAGWSTNKALKYEAGHKTTIQAPGREGETITSTADAYRLTIIEKQNRPLVNKNVSDGKQLDWWENYSGKVHCCTVPGDGIIYVRRNGIVQWAGNSSHGQKGTIGMIYREEDMYFTDTGMVPDVILNPFAFPKRMTMGQMVECICGKIAATKGIEIDSTPFMGYDTTKFGEILQKHCGFHFSGKEYVYNGQTGTPIQADIFIGPTYYYRLKHMVEDKIHSRSTGPYQVLTKQPTEGRNRDGGLRLGEMERDSLLGHGVVNMLKERTFDCSDKYLYYVCSNCGSMVAANPANNIFKCLYCDEGTNIDYHQVRIPYACKLFFQEMEAMTIQPRIYVK